MKGRRNLAAVVARESRLPRSKARSVAEAMHRARAVSVAFKGMYKLYTMPAVRRLVWVET